MHFANVTYETLQQAKDNVLILPLGAIEQHGPQLATGTDMHIVTRVAEAVERQRQAEIILAPTLAFGSSHHHLSFGGTISISADTYTQVLREMVASLIRAGFRRIILLNGHGGNITPAKQALALLSHDLDETVQPNIALATYWELAGSAFGGEPPMESPALSHACEYETSLMLYLYPERVSMERVQRAGRPPQNGYIAWEDDIPYKGVTLFKQTAFLSSNGSSGEPQLATAAKGNHLFDKATDSLLRFADAFRDWPLMEKLAK